MENQNVIWIGLIGAGDKNPINERLLKAILAKALAWGETPPAKIDILKKNRFVFMVGSLDDDRRKVMRVADSYRKAGVINSRFVTVANTDRKMPGASYFEEAIMYLDSK